jgi:hypothetical protein
MAHKQWIKQPHTWPPVKEVEGWFQGNHFYWLDGPNNPQQHPRDDVFWSEFLALDSYRQDILTQINNMEHQLKSLKRIEKKLEKKLNNYPTS